MAKVRRETRGGGHYYYSLLPIQHPVHAIRERDRYAPLVSSFAFNTFAFAYAFAPAIFFFAIFFSCFSLWAILQTNWTAMEANYRFDKSVGWHPTIIILHYIIICIWIYFTIHNLHFTIYNIRVIWDDGTQSRRTSVGTYREEMYNPNTSFCHRFGSSFASK